MKTSTISALLCLSLISLSAIASADTFTLFNTGQNVASGANDPNYFINGNPAVVVSNNVPDWLPNQSNAKWISVDANGGWGTVPNGGITTFTYTFSLTGFDSTTASIQGNWTSDNMGVMYLNGVQIASIASGLGQFEYDRLHSFSATSGFVSGINTMTFVVTNGEAGYTDPGPTGMLVEMTGSAQPAPEPFTMSLCAVTAAALVKRRQIKG